MAYFSLLLEYLYMPIVVSLYLLHIKLVKLDTKVQDYLDFKKYIYSSLLEIKIDLHHLVKLREDDTK